MITPDTGSGGPSGIVPDTKDWTWVLERTCPECGFDSRAFPREEVPARLRANAAAWLPVLAGAGVRERPRPDVWSPLEYACHVRDTCRVYTGRLHRMLTEDDPLYADWDQDATAVAERYGEQDPAAVGRELTAAADTLASRFGTVEGTAWQRPGRRDDGAAFTVETFARYFLHDPVHHLWDVTRAR